MSGVTSEGFDTRTLTDLLTEIGDDQKDAFGANFKNDQASSVIAQLNGIISERLAELWEVAQGTAGALDPDNAEGAQLRALCALTGTVPLEPRASTVLLTLTGDPGTVVSLGTQVSVAGTDDVFNITWVEATIGGTDDSWATGTAYVVGDYVTNAGNIYYCTDAGTSAGAGTGPDTEDAAIVDNGVIWAFLGAGTGHVAGITAESVEEAAVLAPARSLTVIETPVAGWLGVINPLDATPGQAVESDAALRLRRVQELQGGASGTADAIRTDVLQVDGVIACDVFTNATDATDGDGVPPHSIEVLVRGGDADDIRSAIFGQVAAGIGTYGSTSGSVVDSQGNSHTVKFSRPTEVDIYIAVTLIKVAADYPSDGDAQVKAALVEYGDALAHGYDVYAAQLYSKIFEVAGVLNVTGLLVGTAPSPVSSSVSITSRQLAVFDTSRITVATSNGTP